MKFLMTLVVLLGVTRAYSQKTSPNNRPQKVYPKYNESFTESEKKFVNCVINYEKEIVCEVTKRSDNHIVVEFPSTIYVLNPYGYVEDVWILEDADWIKLGKESD
jgi:hypothetical protein